MKKQSMVVCLFLHIFTYTYTQHKAVIVVPVADLVGQPIKTLYPEQSITQSYKSLPLCGGGTLAEAGEVCPRIHQLLCNEIVDVITEKDEEVQIYTPHIFYITPNQKKISLFWTAKRNLIPLHTLIQHHSDVNKLPKPINYKNHSLTACNQNTITLIDPFTDPITKQIFSAGTRFVCAQPIQKNKKIAVYALNPHTKHMYIMHIPSHLCMHDACTHQEKIKNYVRTLQHWSAPQYNVIPYVWGGCSLTTRKPMHRFVQYERSMPNNTTRIYYAVPQDTQYPQTGFDCAGIILRAAQLSGLPYFCKNSMTAYKTLPHLQQDGTIEAGDIIYIPGHVMVVSDLEKGLIVEARGYDHGYGKVHEIPLVQEFRDMHNFTDLQLAYQAKKPLVRLNKAGEVVQMVTNWTVLKLTSLGR